LGINLLDGVREACQRVAERAAHVQIARDRIGPYAASLPLDVIARPEHDPASHYLGHDDGTLVFFVVLDSINFGSGYFPHLRKRPGMSGYFTMASWLNDHFRAHGPFSAQELAQLSVQDCTRISGQDPGNAPIQELMGHFRTALNDLGRSVHERFDDSFVHLVEAAGGSAERLVQVLSEMPYFRDVEPYGELQVPFFKRAQLTAADLAIAFRGQGPGRFDDLDRLTIFADNLVPHVLRRDGILHYEEALAARIDHEELIPSGSAEEVEIRACALHSVELLAAELRRAGQHVSPMQLDYLLWNRGQQPDYKAHPRHRTRTVYY
jgi:hypothetical protein